MNARISDFCHFVDGEDDLVALYNSLTLGVVVVERKVADIFRHSKRKVLSFEELGGLTYSGGKELLEQLIRHKLLFPLGQRLDLEDYSKIQSSLDCKNIGILYLLTTDACNLGCRYCFIETAMPNDYHFSAMTTGTAKFGIDLFAASLGRSHGIDEPQIIFYGGEPLMNSSVIEWSLLYINQLKVGGQLPANTSITVNTNGTLIDQNTVRILKNAENLNVAISLDGPREIHDLCRKYRSGADTFEDIIRNHHVLVDEGIEAGFCCTINKYNIDHLEEISKWLVDEMGAKSLGFNLLIESVGVDDVRGEAKIYAEKAARQIIKCFRFFRERGIYEDRIMRKVNAFVDGYIYFHDCGGCGQQMVVTPDGMVGVCQGYCGSKKYFVKLKKDFDPLEHPVWELWRYRSPLYMPQCRDCLALSVCGGGCPYSADVRNGSIWELDDIFCVHAKATIEFLIKDLIKETSPPR